jgi:hypothetical protein
MSNTVVSKNISNDVFNNIINYLNQNTKIFINKASYENHKDYINTVNLVRLVEKMCINLILRIKIANYVDEIECKREKITAINWYITD